ncbi:type I-C CRISPR-associated protein Cas7/Csd2 [Natranaerobius trueperi]|uniref:Type I-C CRISPR-associated protein Cas7/Csd2 n=1 Tax=Natranaerobius trueperi TaxID=759412 RepID=A0A226BXY6_9FIRM|nr:type I-C CRISPR-associated protein Cas7/Csd2 [Natranaerobius trueperi]OWZ83866.1 type I-C CRISPR-associated protein Cas7/Csd2 [Natranaerobius trueperi]
MSILDYKIDFAVVFLVKNANPNGDPLNGNRPRQNYEGFGEVSDVCIKRKIRNRLQDQGEPIFVQSDERKNDGFKSLKERADSVKELKETKDKDLYHDISCETWTDVRSFGQVFAFKGGESTSIGVRGPVSIHPAISLHPVDITSTQITKSVNSTTSDNKGSDTMGMKHRVDFGVYVFYGSINTQLAEKTKFTKEDAEKIKYSLETLFENDASSARPDGSMTINKVYWWKHNTKLGQYPSGKVHRSLSIELKEETPKTMDDVKIELSNLKGLDVEVYDGE